MRLQLIVVSKRLLRRLTIRSRRASPEGELGQSSRKFIILFLNNILRHDSQYATIDRIKQAIVVLEVKRLPFFIDWLSLTMFCKGRLINLYDIPRRIPYLFEDPVLSSEEAQAMLSQMRREDFGASKMLKISMTSLTPLSDKIIKVMKARLEDISEPWEDVDFHKILNAERQRLRVSVKVFMKALRYALTGMKVGLFRIFLSLFFLYTNIRFLSGWT